MEPVEIMVRLNRLPILALCLMVLLGAFQVSHAQWTELADLGMRAKRGLLFSCAKEGESCFSDLDCGFGCKCHRDFCKDTDGDDDDDFDDDDGGLQVGTGFTPTPAQGSGVSGNLIQSLFGILGGLF